MWEWNRINFKNSEIASNYISEFRNTPKLHFSYYPFDSISQDSSLTYDTGCWDENFEKLSRICVIIWNDS